MKLMVTFLVLIIFSFKCYSWDGKRQGFLLGLAGGGGQMEYKDLVFEKLGTNPARGTTSAIMFSPKVGYAFTDQFALVYSRHPYMFSGEKNDGDKLAITACVEAVGIYLYTSATAPSLFFGISGGRSFLFEKEQYESGYLMGTGYSLLIGYEFLPHFSLEIHAASLSPKNDAKLSGVGLMLSVLGY